MSGTERRYKRIMRHLKAAWDEIVPLTEVGDFAAVILLKEEFRNLRDAVKQFARCQHGGGAERTRPPA
jgi:hypothetical protein